MDAQRFWVALGLWISMASLSLGQGGRSQTQNFVVAAANPRLADEVAQFAERYRHDLAMLWLGKELPPWSQPCPIRVMAAPNRGAGGKTSFAFQNGMVGGWDMEVEGSRERILDSVLPHEITHTIFATHFAPLGKPVPRWADEGASTTVEHLSERSKHDDNLVAFLHRNRGIAFATMFTLKEYPQDIMPLYAQGYSVASFLIAQGGPEGHRRFVRFLEEGMQTEDWVTATERLYGYPTVGKLQVAWNKWVGNGGGAVDSYTAIAMGHVATNGGNVRLASATLPGPMNPAANPIGSPAFAALDGRADPISLSDSSRAQRIPDPNVPSNAIATTPSDNYYRQLLQQNTGNSGQARIPQEPSLNAPAMQAQTLGGFAPPTNLIR